MDRRRAIAMMVSFAATALVGCQAILGIDPGACWAIVNGKETRLDLDYAPPKSATNAF